MWASHRIRESPPVEQLQAPGRSNGDKTGPLGGLPACGKLWTMLASPPPLWPKPTIIMTSSAATNPGKLPAAEHHPIAAPRRDRLQFDGPGHGAQ